MRFLRAVCGRRAALCGETEGCTPTRDAASRAVAPLPPQSAATACALRESGPPARFPGFGAPNVSQNHAPCTVSKRVGFAKRKKGRTPARDAASRVVAPSFLCNPQRRLCRHAFWDSARRMSLKTMRLARFPSASALPTRKKGCTPARDAASRAVDPLPLQSAAIACALRESGPPARFPGFGAPNVSQNHAPCMASKRVGFAKRKKGRTPARDAASGLSFRRWRCFGCGSCGRRCRRGRPAPRACRTRRCARPG